MAVHDHGGDRGQVAGPTDDRLEPCEECGRDTPHEVSLELVRLSESDFAQEPRRIARCERCGTVTATLVTRQ